jgi:predicted HTH transcriptional regulator
MPQDLTTSLLAEILEQRNLQKLIGLKENLWFEAKSKTPYDLSTAIGRYEVAKDVSSFANSEGGYLIIGLRTDRLIEENTDKVVSLDWLKKEEFPISQYRGIIDEYIHPRMENIALKWIGGTNNSELGVGCIYIPPQAENKKHFLIKNVTEGGELLQGIVFGLSRRVKSSNVPFDITEVHRAIQQGKSPVPERLTAMENKMDTVIDTLRKLSQPSQVFPDKILEERIKTIIS